MRRSRMVAIILWIMCMVVQCSSASVYAMDEFYSITNNIGYDAIFLGKLKSYDGENLVLDQVNVLYDKSERYKDRKSMENIEVSCCQKDMEIDGNAVGNYVLIPTVRKNGEMEANVRMSMIASYDNLKDIKIQKYLIGCEMSEGNKAQMEYYLNHGCQPVEFYYGDGIVRKRSNDEIIYPTKAIVTKKPVSEKNNQKTVKKKEKKETYMKFAFGGVSGVLVVGYICYRIKKVKFSGV